MDLQRWLVVGIRRYCLCIVTSSGHAALKPQLIKENNMSEWKRLVSDPSRKKAIFFLMLLVGVSLVSKAGEVAVAQLMLEMLFGFFYSFLAVFLICVIRGEEKAHKKNPLLMIKMGAWSYIWRAYVIILGSSMLALGLLVLLFSYQFPLGPFGLSHVVLWVFSTFCMPVVCWLFFSKSRMSQLHWLLSTARAAFFLR